MSRTHSLATRLGKRLSDVRKNGALRWLRPDGNTQVTIERVQTTVVISTQDSEPLKAVRRKNVEIPTSPLPA